MTLVDPLLIDVPTRIVTARFILRRPLPGDGPLLHEAVWASFDELKPWMPWATERPTQEKAEADCRRLSARFGLRSDLTMFIFERQDDGEEGDFLGGCGLHRIDWTLRKFEVGYWLRQSAQRRGAMVEIVTALTRLAFDTLGARRVEIRTDDLNERSWRVAERAGFALEGVLRQDSLAPNGLPRDTRVYARVLGIEEPGPS